MLTRRHTVMVVVISTTLAVWIAYRSYRCENDRKRRLCNRRRDEQIGRDREAEARRREAGRRAECERAVSAPPEIENLRHLAKSYAEDPEDWAVLLACGDIYQKGAYPRLKPHDEMAMRCFSCAGRCPDPVVAGQGQSKYANALLHRVPCFDRVGKEMDTRYGTAICDRAESMLRLCTALARRPRAVLLPSPAHVRQTAVRREAPCRAEAVYRAAPVHAHVHHHYSTTAPPRRRDKRYARPRRARAANEGVVVGVQPDAPVPVPAHRQDAQNVHENSVVAATKANIETLKALQSHEGRRNNAMGEVRKKVLELKPGRASDANMTLDKLNDTPHGTFGASEKEVLGLVWNKIDRIGDETVRRNVRETLCEQLADCVENGMVCCSTGRVSRMVAALEGIDSVPLQRTRPVWAVNEELGILAANVRERMLKGGDRVAYDAGDDAISARMRDQFLLEARHTYCDELGMDRKVLDPLLEVYSDAL